MRDNISVIGVIPQYPSHSQHNIYAKVRMPPVGIISVLSQLEDMDIYAIDENNYGGPRDFTGMPDHFFLQKNNPAKVAMFYGGMSNSVPRLFSVAQQYKKWGALTVAGGSHVDALPKEALGSGIDIVVHGEGEETIKEVMGSIFTSGELVEGYKNLLRSIKGISFIDDNQEYRFTGVREPIRDLDGLKPTDLTLIKHLRKRWTAIPVNRGRGCNFNCEFCVVNKQYGRFKSASINSALQQVIKHADIGYKSFFMTDDNFAQNPAEAIELCNAIGDYKRQFNKKISITVQVRTEVAYNDKLLEAMKYAGVNTLAIGYESPINEELKAMRKGVTVEKLIERSKKLSEHFYLHGMFIFGYPTFKDSKYRSSLTLEERAKAYYSFFRAARIDTIQVLNAVPLPGSELRRRLVDEGRIFPLEMVGWDKYDGAFLCYDPTPEGLDAYTLQHLPRHLMKKRYLGNFASRNLNYGNWMTWVGNALGFPLQFSAFYVSRFVHDSVERMRERRVELPDSNLFHQALVEAWGDIKRRWRNLGIKTYAGEIVRGWMREYKKSDHGKRLREAISQSKGKSIPTQSAL